MSERQQALGQGRGELFAHAPVEMKRQRPDQDVKHAVATYLEPSVARRRQGRTHVNQLVSHEHRPIHATE
jgi:hypothetical protein